MPQRRGRAAADNPPNRFERLHHVEDPAALGEDDLRQVPTVFFRDHARSILARNDSPDLPFRYSLNPYRGCEHGCAYCLSGDTPILMADGRTKPLAELRVGDAIYGTERRGWYRRHVKTRVLDHWVTRKPAFRLTLADDTTLVASGDHRFLTERGWKYVTGTQQGTGRRPHLTLNNALMGTGAFAAPPAQTPDYARGYLCGLIRGDGLLKHYPYERPGRAHGDIWTFRLALTDTEALRRCRSFLHRFEVPTHAFAFAHGTGAAPLQAIRTNARGHVERIQRLIRWPVAPSEDWQRGFIAGLFDAEGSFSGGALRISNADPVILRHLEGALGRLGFRFTYDVPHATPNTVVRCLRLLGGLREHLRFFHTMDPAITRKRDIEGLALKSGADLRVVEIEPLGREIELFDITTGTGDFIANGVVSHNCYARPSHEYLGFSAGLDFETKILVKEDAPDLLREAFRKPGWEPQVVLISGNTDCYQPVERRLALTRRCLEVFLEFRNPVSIITKNHLVTRDLDLLAELAALDLVRVTLSITSLRDDVIHQMEPRTSRPARRLAAIERLAEAGVPVGVNAAPLIPGLTDEELPAILEAAAERGARWAGYGFARLPGPVKPIFLAWVERAFPDRADRIKHRLEDVWGPEMNDPRFGHRMRGQGTWAATVHTLFGLTCRRLGLNAERRALSTAHFRRSPPGQMELF